MPDPSAESGTAKQEATGSYSQDAFEQSASESASKPSLGPAAAAAAPKAKPAGAASASVGTAPQARPVASELKAVDEPRRVTCEAEVQVNMTVDAGVQCDPLPPPPPNFAGLLGAWPQAPSSMAAAQAALHAAAYPPGFPYAANPYGPQLGHPPPSPYPHWGYGGGFPPQPCPGGYPPHAPPQPPLMRDLFGAAMYPPGPPQGGLGFGVPPGPPREAWGPLGASDAAHTMHSAPSRAGAAAAASSGGGGREVPPGPLFGQGGSTPGPTTAEMWALGMIDEGFRAQLERLRYEAARNRAWLERAGVRLDGGAGSTAHGTDAGGEPGPPPPESAGTPYGASDAGRFSQTR